jgi:ribosomal protein S18 acetylase RimI-like enzyme
MPLPVIGARHEASESDLLRLFHKTGAMWAGHLAEPEQLEVGTAFVNGELGRVWDANQVRDVALPAGESVEGVMKEVEECFAGKGSRCLKWVMNPSAPEGQTRPIVEHLLRLGYRAREWEVFYLRHAPEGPVAQVGGLKIIPARASYRHSRELAEEWARECWAEVAEQLTEAWVGHLDDAHFDALIALNEERAVARVGVLAVGEIGLVEGLFVSREYRRQGIGRTMMSRAMEICARSLFRHVFVALEVGNEVAKGLYRKLGFEAVGRATRYIALWG